MFALEDVTDDLSIGVPVLNRGSQVLKKNGGNVMGITVWHWIVTILFRN
jgi:hypothetical protein